MLTDTQKEFYETQGYFITEDAVDPDMFEPLLEATRRVKQKVRAGEVDVFTHWMAPGEPWAIRGLFAPEMGEPIFAEYLMSDPVMGYVEPFLGSELQLGGVVIFTNTYHEDTSIGWHRDFGKNPRDGSPEVEMEILNRPMTRLKWHLALVNDACLRLVPGSNCRYRTEFERECLLNGREDEIPGQKVIDLKAGQTCFWNGHTIHRGIYPKDAERLTLSGSWAKYPQPDEKPEVVDDRLRWMLAKNMRAFLPEGMRVAYDRWRAPQLEN